MDHQALTWLLTEKEPIGRMARWVESLMAYNPMIKYKKGTANIADFLSRIAGQDKETKNSAEVSQMIQHE